MRQILKALALAALLLPGIAAAQTPQYPQTLPANSVWGRLGISPGPPQAIPFSTLSARLTGASITLNSGNGQTAPGSMAGGNTYTFGANSDTPRFAGIGLGGAAPATGIELYTAAVTPTGNGQGMVGTTSTNGGVLQGQGSVYDAVLANKSGAVSLGIATGTTGAVLTGTLTAASLSTVGTVAGSICATSAGLILYEAGVNCFTVSGISVASGKTLTVNNTLTLNGTDGTVFTFPGATDTVATLGASQTVTGNKTFSGTVNITGTGQINGTAFGTFATQNFATPPAIGGTTPAAGSFSTLTATTPVGLTSGGTNATTAAGARASGGLNIEALTSHGDSNYSILVTDRAVGTSATLTASRTWTLPAASGVNAGQTLYVQDFKGFVSNVNTLVIVRNGSDTINGGTGSQTINNANGGFLFVSDGVSNWSAQALGAQASAGVASINGQTGNPSIVAGTAISVSSSGGNISVGNTGVASFNGQTGAIIQSPICGRYAFSSTTATTFKPFACEQIRISGTAFAIPSAGIAGCGNTSVFVNGTGASNLAASTFYYVYAFSNSGTLTCDFSTTAHATSATAGNVGTEIKSGDDTRSLIGMARTNGSSQFADSATQRFVRSWFNDPGVGGENWFTAVRSTSSTTYVEVNSEIRIEFLTWSGEPVQVNASGRVFASVSSNNPNTSFGFNGTTAEKANTESASPSPNLRTSASIGMTKTGLTEGYNYVTILGFVNNTGTANWDSPATGPGQYFTLYLRAKR